MLFSVGTAAPGAGERAPSAFAGFWHWLTQRDNYAPPDAGSEIGRLLWHYPPPLIDPTNRLVVIFSAKSACTNVLVWFFHHLGHAKAVRDYHPSPHQYRTQVYYRSKLYQRAYRMNFSRARVIRVIRDPYARAASGFRHLLRHAHAPFGRRMGMSHIAQQGLSFSEYIDFLDRLDLRTCDPHFGVQRHPLEEKLSTSYLINVSTEDLYQRLNEIESELGLERTDLRSSDWVARIDRRNRPEGTPGTADAYTQRLYPEQANKGPWPPYEQLLTPAARTRLARLYALDIEKYEIK